MSLLASLLLMVGICAAAPEPEAPEAAPMARVRYDSLTGIRVNPLGLVQRMRLSYRHRLFTDDGALFEPAWLDVGVVSNLAPTFISAGPRVEVRPLAVLGLAAQLEYMGYFGVLNAVMPVDSTDDDYWEDTLALRGEGGESYATGGTRLTLSGLLQGKAGPVIVRNNLSAVRLDFAMAPGDAYSYDATYDLVVADGGWLLVDDLDVGVLLGGLAAGVRYTFSDSLLADDSVADEANHRVGPLVAYTFPTPRDRPGYAKPTLLLIAQWHLQHPWRAGQRQTVAYPLIAAAFQFQGDLWRGVR